MSSSSVCLAFLMMSSRFSSRSVRKRFSCVLFMVVVTDGRTTSSPTGAAFAIFGRVIGSSRAAFPSCLSSFTSEGLSFALLGGAAAAPFAGALSCLSLLGALALDAGAAAGFAVAFDFGAGGLGGGPLGGWGGRGAVNGPPGARGKKGGLPI